MEAALLFFGEVDVLLYPNSDFTGTLGKYTITSASFTFVDGAEEYVAVRYNFGGELLHTLNANTTTWTDTLSLPIRIENSSGSGVSMNVRAATIYRLGNLLTQPTSYYHASGQTAGVNLKIGAGNIHSCTLLSMTNNAVVTLSDSLTTTTPVILATTATATTGVPLPIDLKGLPFFNGLRLTVSGANASVLVIYE